ncbi:monoamine oxidase N [Hortaea werneckii]|uniref:Amine oxidase n=1 Tax=Hortaea werneckii TaxID=91943 RepID=A0A3M7CNH8_HORWE|nr:monoamine oxidase N [Hortaea werneckii]KAI7717769.1 monoamine oxidase N [Hortaea werneckii]RMY53678.1 hypothetical protein D0865_05111 [Hortaea werneckii]
MTSRDGYQWTDASGLVRGVPSIGVIEPASNINDLNQLYDVIVVGGGYCGLTAARDLALSGLSVCLLEGRDRIGGRSWSTNIGGYPFEMGGTWVSWGQPHVWREISRYDMRDQLECSYDFSRGVNHFSLGSQEERRTMSHDEADRLITGAALKFVNVDGEYGKTIMPQPHHEFFNPAVKKFDKLSVADRIEQIKDDLSPDELTALQAFVLLSSCAKPEESSFYEFLHWWALCNHDYAYCIEYLIKYKFRGGQSSFAIKFFEEALSTNRLSYAFNSPAAKISDRDGHVEVSTRSGQRYKASRVVSTIPLNVLNDISFDPPLALGKQDAARVGHVNMCAKVHAECRNPELRSWGGVRYPDNKLMYAIADGTTPAGNTHIVAFGASHNPLKPEQDIEQTKRAVTGLVPALIERLVFHNWVDDEFAKGAWFFPAPGFVTERLDDLRRRQGNVLFANSDWAVGWRSFIDGAIEEGARAAKGILDDLRKNSVQPKGSRL